jgi:hypothetical protein
MLSTGATNQRWRWKLRIKAVSATYSFGGGEDGMIDEATAACQSNRKEFRYTHGHVWTLPLLDSVTREHAE